MKAIRCDLPKDLENVDIITLSDLHKGDLQSDTKLFMQRIRKVAETPNLFAILHGDILNMAIMGCKSDIYAETISPMDQIKTGVQMLEPIKNKILCIVPGNHEERAKKTAGIDVTSIIAAQLDILDRCSDTTALLFIRFGEQSAKKHFRPICYTAYVTHGCGGGKKEGGKINRLADLAGIVDADIYLHGHTHLPVIFKESFFRTDTSNSAIALVDKLFVNSGAHLDYGGYGEMQGYKPASKATPTIHLDGKHKDMTATL